MLKATTSEPQDSQHILSTEPADLMRDPNLSLRPLLDTSDVLVAVFDSTDRLTYANTSFRTSFAIASNENPTWTEMMHRNYRARRGAYINTDDFEAWLVSALSRRGKKAFRAFESDLCDGRWIWMTETVRPDGSMLCIASDITDICDGERTLRQARDVALRDAQTDHLTGIANRRSILIQLKQLIDETLQVDTGGIRNGCMAIFDLDHFKSINDTHGHLAGDAVLRNFAHRTLSLLRRSDSLGRIGGEEFMLLLPDTKLIDAQSVIQRILSETRLSRPLDAVPGFSFTCSAGLTAVQPGDTGITLYERADAALYRSKQEGRDRLTVAE